ncbi:hypothetical protein DPMN_010184 [Dreissena polymorpha]|uniref:Uncharacterized protein n=1 Tax=Dreissena polymorpha TaxID=45954 RepID=A0A9D4S0T6_DREPO|nr:hypothetical protein DPMN_010184 [Dreissena polymorpha]
MVLLKIAGSCKCGPGSFLCSRYPTTSLTPQCLRLNKVCDGTRDCPLGDDEAHCFRKSFE